jgi:hypothetical protein
MFQILSVKPETKKLIGLNTQMVQINDKENTKAGTGIRTVVPEI